MKVYFYLMLLLCPSSFLWAQKELPIDNFHFVDSALYRSAQPSSLEMSILEKKEIYEIVNLRRFWKDNRKVQRPSSLQLKWLPLATAKVTSNDLIEALRIIVNRKSDMLVHCWHGSDRTGAVIAAYRIVVQDWTKEKAIHEMMDGGFGFHKIFSNLPRLIRSIDVEAFRKSLNINVLPTN